MGFFVVRWALPDLAKYLLITGLSLGLSLVLYEYAVRRVNLLRILFGMRPRRRLAPGEAPLAGQVVAG